MSRLLTKFNRSTRGKGQRDHDPYFHYPDFNLDPAFDLFCLSENTVTLAYLLVREYGKWRNRFVQDTGADVWLGLTDDEWSNVQDWYEQALEELKMPLDLTPLADAIRYLADNQPQPQTDNTNVDVDVGCGCCGGAGTTGTGQTDAPPTTIILDGQTPPEGFDDLPQYDQYKCDVASKIIDDWIADIENLAFVNGASLATAIAGITALALTPLPFARVAAIAGIVILFFGAGTSVIAEAVAVVTNRRNDLICALLNAISEPEAETRLNDIIKAEVDDAVSSVNAFYVQTILSNYVVADSLNRLFEKDETIIYPVSDCSSCQSSGLCLPFIDSGVGDIRTDGIAFTVDSVVLPQVPNLVSITNDRDDPACETSSWYVEFLDLPAIKPDGGTSSIFYWSEEDNQINTIRFEGAWPALNTPYRCASFDLMADVAFTATMRIWAESDAPVDPINQAPVVNHITTETTIEPYSQKTLDILGDHFEPTMTTDAISGLAEGVVVEGFEYVSKNQLRVDIAVNNTSPSAAVGAGANSAGGTGGQVLTVTNLNNDGPGSFRNAAESAGARIIQFAVSGNIDLQSALIITNPYLTIDGSTAPGKGVCVTGHRVEIRTHDVIVRYMRFRTGDTSNFSDHDSNRCLMLSVSNDLQDFARNVLIDHCSFSWSIDTTVSIYNSPWSDTNPSSNNGKPYIENVTISNCMIYEPLANSLHSEGQHSRAMIISEGVKNISIINTFFAHSYVRNAQIKGGRVEFVNNTLYNCVQKTTCGKGTDKPGVDPLELTYIGNYQIDGTNNANSRMVVLAGENTDGCDGNKDHQIYVLDNIGPSRPNNTDDQWAMTACKFSGSASVIPARFRANSPFALPGIPYSPQAPLTAHNALLSHIGCSLPARDSADTRIINDIQNGTGQLIDSQTEVGGFPDLS